MNTFTPVTDAIFMSILLRRPNRTGRSLAVDPQWEVPTLQEVKMGPYIPRLSAPQRPREQVPVGLYNNSFIVRVLLSAWVNLCGGNLTFFHLRQVVQHHKRLNAFRNAHGKHWQQKLFERMARGSEVD
ncbi:MAG: uncharacterized protein KVP18_002922 [Porospora cf. gigantea A]|uniref:uncharacterized protein n=1 Tax=Porospora cf. gigantea A TaxID=2853593 RepID=UPI0035594ED9|nr:MAG: hypothetical protein KVP18_002922 [Porospora cf. gigantea A]